MDQSLNQGSRAPCVLAIDDSDQNRGLVAEQLRSAGYAVRQACSGEEGLAAYQKDTPDLVLLDIMMPGLDGFETCQRLRQLPGGRDVPVVLLTALSDLTTQSQAMECGADDFLTKPIQRTELLIRVRSLVRIKALQAELRNGYELILASRNALLAAQRQKDELAELVVHDLKSPLSTIQVNLRYLHEATHLGDEEREAIRDSLASVQHLQNMAVNLLSLSRADGGNLVPSVQMVDLCEMIEWIARSLKYRLLEHKQRLLTDIEQNTFVRGDPQLLQRLVENLLDNCMRYSPDATQIQVGLRQIDNGFVELRIRDQGPGIPAEFREKIFEKYVRLDKEGRTAAYRGAGLGLAFCRLSAEVHGGRIWVEENPEGGSCFCVRLPKGTSPSP